MFGFVGGEIMGVAQACRVQIFDGSFSAPNFWFVRHQGSVWGIEFLPCFSRPRCSFLIRIDLFLGRRHLTSTVYIVAMVVVVVVVVVVVIVVVVVVVVVVVLSAASPAPRRPRCPWRPWHPESGVPGIPAAQSPGINLNV